MDIEQLRARGVSACLALLERVKGATSADELRRLGLLVTSAESRDGLCAMTVQAAAQAGVDLDRRDEAERYFELKDGMLYAFRGTTVRTDASFQRMRHARVLAREGWDDLEADLEML